MNRLVAVGITIALLTACQKENSDSQKDNLTTNKSLSESQTQIEKTVQTESERLNQWFEVKYEEQLQMSPIGLTFLGRKDKYDQIDEATEAEEKRQLKWQGESVSELKLMFDYEKLNQETKTSYDIWVYQYEQALEGQQFTRNAYVFTQMQGIQSFAAQFLINFHKVDNESDMKAYIKRIAGVSRIISDFLDRAKVYANGGVRPPRFAYEGVIEQAQNLVTGAPFTKATDDAPLWADAKSKISALLEKEEINEEQSTQLKADAKQALISHFQPSYEKLISWFKNDIDNTAEIGQGVGSQPNGKNYYNYQLKMSTTTNLTADEIHQIGLKEVNRLTNEMEAIKNKVNFKGSLQDFFDYIKTDQRFFYPNTDIGRQGYITDSENYLAFINQELPKYFGILPKADLVVKRVEAFREQDGAAQHYFPGTPDGKRPGVYYAHLSDMKSMPKNEMEAIAYHEGSPGHHMQISIAQELTSVPQFRTQANFNAYAEGWGLYSELLAKEMGAYKSEYSDFGRLTTEIWRAVRLVVDTGLHSKGWTEEQAVAFFTEKTPIAEGAVKSEVRRYMVWPGQATGYKIGMLKILELRAFAEKELADKFDIRAFHDTILGGGAMPLTILERRVKEWVDANK
ncbi:MAG: DUF885 domain-containing protein [Kangiella sp.]|nr:MAG: DUF885 domain-containing protein [Kangiella sp.]